MNHVEIIKRAFSITWRYRALWIFGFFLALCGGGGGGSSNFNFPSGGDVGDFDGFGELSELSDIDPGIIIALIIGMFCLFIFITILGIVVRVVTRTALIGMVGQISETETATIADGWRLGWSSRAWRLFLLTLVITIPWVLISVILLLLAFSPLILLLIDSTALRVVSVAVTVLAVLFVVLILIILGVVITLFLDLARRRVVLDEIGVFAGISDTVRIIRQRPKDILIIWLLMLGIAFAWAFIALLIVLPIALITAALVGIGPALIVYLISNSFVGTLVAGGSLALLTIIIVFSAAGGLYLIFRSAVWTLTYLEVKGPKEASGQRADTPIDSDPSAPALDPQTNL